MPRVIKHTISPTTISAMLVEVYLEEPIKMNDINLVSLHNCFMRLTSLHVTQVSFMGKKSVAIHV